MRIALNVLAITALASSVSAATVEWGGESWTYFGDVGVEDGRLRVTTLQLPGGDEPWYWASLSYETSAAFRAAPEVAVRVRFADPGVATPGSGVMDQVMQVFGPSPSLQPLASTGLSWIYGDRNRFDWSIGGGNVGRVDVGPRTAGVHTWEVRKHADGTMSFWFDGGYAGEFGQGAAAWDSIGAVALYVSTGQGSGTVEFLGYSTLQRMPGDANWDGVVDLADLNEVLNGFGDEGKRLAGDENGDGVVDLGDLNRVLNHFTGGVEEGLTVVPEAGVVWGGVGVVVVTWGRRRPRCRWGACGDGDIWVGWAGAVQRLGVRRCDAAGLSGQLGEGFVLVGSVGEVHVTPWGKGQALFVLCV